MAKDAILIGAGPLTIEDIVDVAICRAPVLFTDSPEWRQRIDRGADFLQQQRRQFDRRHLLECY